MTILNLIDKYKEDFLIGLSVTLEMSVIVWVLGLVIGTLLGVASVKFKLAVGIPVKALTFLIGSVPVLVFLYWLHYPFQTILGIIVDGYYTTIVTLSIVNILLVANQVGSALESFPNHYVLSGVVSGFSRSQIVKRIQIPLIIRQILPGILIIQVVMMHSTLFGSLISVDEIFRITQRVNSEVYKPVEVYSTLAIFFLILSAPLTGLAYWFNKKFKTKISKY